MECIFEKDRLTVNGTTAAASYTIKKSAVLVMAYVDTKAGKNAVAVRVENNDRHYIAALSAALEASAEQAAALEELSIAEPAALAEQPAAEQAADTEQPAAAEQEKKPRREHKAPEVVKPWHKWVITGYKWEIQFGQYDGRLQLHFDEFPKEEVRDAVKEAGFFWSPVAKCWYRKATEKSKRAALELAAKLAQWPDGGRLYTKHNGRDAERVAASAAVLELVTDLKSRPGYYATEKKGA